VTVALRGRVVLERKMRGGKPGNGGFGPRSGLVTKLLGWRPRGAVYSLEMEGLHRGRRSGFSWFGESWRAGLDPGIAGEGGEQPRTNVGDGRYCQTARVR